MWNEAAPPQLPSDTKGYFACKTCRRILNETQWYTQGCSECNTGPVQRGDLMERATPNFSNFIGLVSPGQSWVGRLINKVDCPNGVYAEMLADEEEEELDEFSEDEDIEGE